MALFQPHLYSRTRDFAGDFAEALSSADLAWVAPIYPAREEPIEGVTSALITDAATRGGWTSIRAVEGNLDEITEEIRAELGPNDLFLTMGAGDVHRVSESLAGGER
ncbi:MAG: hypothetical protein LC732_09075 [Acidobacteria bacterium]|nr:hypothetical protein [Acidobacteriota bacterium]